MSEPDCPDSEHLRRLTDLDVEVRWLGSLEGLAVNESNGAVLLFLHGDERSCAVAVDDPAFADALARSGVEVEHVLEGDAGGDDDE